jgi:hypothetical protein
MSDSSPAQFATKDDYPKDTEKVASGEREDSIHDPSIGEGIDILGQQSIDPALNAKMHLVNNVRDSHKRLLPSIALGSSATNPAHLSVCSKECLQLGRNLLVPKEAIQ